MGQDKQQEQVGKNGSGSQPNQNLPIAPEAWGLFMMLWKDLHYKLSLLSS